MGPTRWIRGHTGRVPSSARGRLRIVVVQVLVLSLFATLFARLWFLQVLGGPAYQAQAAQQSIRELVVQPTRGLIVDDMGRPLVTNRTSWVVTVDRTMLNRMSTDQQSILLHRIAAAVGESYRAVHARVLLCGESGSVQGSCWNGSPYQPVPVADDVPQHVAVSVMEQGEDFPGVLVEQQSMRAYPAPYGVNAAGLLGYLSPITASELSTARKDHDATLNGASLVGRAGLELEYDKYLRGLPGHQRLAVDSQGHVLGKTGTVKGRVGDTVVTSIDAKVQAVVERQLASTIQRARRTYDPVTHRNYVADSGAAVVLDARNGRVVAMAGYPTYNPNLWVGGITSRQLKRLYSKKAGDPLLFRPTQGQFAPGSTWKPFMTAGAFAHGLGANTRFDCSSSFQVGNRLFKNYESESFGMIDFAQALQVSCDTFFYRVGYHFWQKFGSDPTNVHARDPLVHEAKVFDFGKPTGVDLPGEAAGRVADRAWKLAYWKANRGYYCRLGKKPGSDFIHLFARQFCVDGYTYRAGDAVNFSIGQGDTLVTPLQSARAYAALANGGTLFAPRIAKAIVGPDGRVVKTIPPKVVGHVKMTRSTQHYIDQALLGTTKVGTTAWKFLGFPLDKVRVRSKTGSAEVYGKQSTSWVASYDKRYVVLMMVTQGGTGSGTVGPAVRRIWEALYGVRGMAVHPAKAALPGARPPVGLPVFTSHGEILPPRTRTERKAR